MVQLIRFVPEMAFYDNRDRQTETAGFMGKMISEHATDNFNHIQVK